MGAKGIAIALKLQSLQTVGCLPLVPSRPDLAEQSLLCLEVLGNIQKTKPGVQEPWQGAETWGLQLCAFPWAFQGVNPEFPYEGKGHWALGSMPNQRAPRALNCSGLQFVLDVPISFSLSETLEGSEGREGPAQPLLFVWQETFVMQAAPWSLDTEINH